MNVKYLESSFSVYFSSKTYCLLAVDASQWPSARSGAEVQVQVPSAVSEIFSHMSPSIMHGITRQAFSHNSRTIFTGFNYRIFICWLIFIISGCAY